MITVAVEWKVHIFVNILAGTSVIYQFIHLEFRKSTCPDELHSILVNIGLGNSFAPVNIWTTADVFSIGPYRSNVNETSRDITTFLSRKYIWKCRLWNTVRFVLDSICLNFVIFVWFVWSANQTLNMPGRVLFFSLYFRWISTFHPSEWN